MNTQELFEILKSKAVDGKGFLLLSKLTSRMEFNKRVRSVLKFEFEISNFWSNGFVFKHEDQERILNIINNKSCETQIL